MDTTANTNITALVTRINRQTGSSISVYTLQQLDGKHHITSCNTHNESTESATRAVRDLVARIPADWCKGCAKMAKRAPAARKAATPRAKFTDEQKVKAFTFIHDMFAADAEDIAGYMDMDKATARKLARQLPDVVGDTVNGEGPIVYQCYNTYDYCTVEEALAKAGLAS